MTELTATYSSPALKSPYTKQVVIDETHHLASLQAAVLKMQAEMNVFLTEEMRSEAGGKPIPLEEANEVKEEEEDEM